MNENTKAGLQRLGTICFAVVALGIGCANIVNGVMLMRDMYISDHPRTFYAIGIEPKDASTGTEATVNENNA